MPIKRAFPNQLHILSKGYGVHSILTSQLNYKLGIAPFSMPVRFKKLVLRNQEIRKRMVRFMNRMRVLSNIEASKQARQLSSFNPNNFQ